MPRDANPRIKDWVNRADAAVLQLMPLHAAMKDLPGSHNHRRAVMLLSTACLASSGSVLYLVEGMRLWDAELVLRSVTEGTAKFGYLLESPATFTARCIEYSEALPMIARLRWHDKAAEALKALGPGEGSERRPFNDLLISDEEQAQIRAAFPRETRKDMERRWGFTALVEAVSRPDGAFGPTGRALLHGYTTASHLQHMSSEGTELPLERDRRSEERRSAIELAHAAKLISDCYDFTFMRAAAVLRFLGRPNEELFKVHKRYQPLFAEFRQAEIDWRKVEYGEATAGGTIKEGHGHPQG